MALKLAMPLKPNPQGENQIHEQTFLTTNQQCRSNLDPGSAATARGDIVRFRSNRKARARGRTTATTQHRPGSGSQNLEKTDGLCACSSRRSDQETSHLR